jgi:predicted DCC family thiol-disulfide oxidoreductase YuxK
VLALPSQTPGLVDRYGLTRRETDRELWAVDSSGSVFSGAAAVNRILTELGRPWSAVAAMYRVPWMQWLEDRAYRWVADHRSCLSRFWSTTPECDLPGVTCK